MWPGASGKSGTNLLPDHRRQARGAILGGCLLVALVMLAEYGAFEILGYPDLHHRDLHRVPGVVQYPASCALVLVLVLLGLVVLGAEAMTRDKGRVRAPRPPGAAGDPTHRLGRATVPVLLGFVALVGLALGVPVGASVYWTFEGGAHRSRASASPAPPGTPSSTAEPQPRWPR